jgi:hypothetical protein
MTVKAKDLKHVAHGPHVARHICLCGIIHLIFQLKNVNCDLFSAFMFLLGYLIKCGFNLRPMEHFSLFYGPPDDMSLSEKLGLNKAATALKLFII